MVDSKAPAGKSPQANDIYYTLQNPGKKTPEEILLAEFKKLKIKIVSPTNIKYFIEDILANKAFLSLDYNTETKIARIEVQGGRGLLGIYAQANDLFFEAKSLDAAYLGFEKLCKLFKKPVPEQEAKAISLLKLKENKIYLSQIKSRVEWSIKTGNIWAYDLRDIYILDKDTFSLDLFDKFVKDVMTLLVTGQTDFIKLCSLGRNTFPLMAPELIAYIYLRLEQEYSSFSAQAQYQFGLKEIFAKLTKQADALLKNEKVSIYRRNTKENLEKEFYKRFSNYCQARGIMQGPFLNPIKIESLSMFDKAKRHIYTVILDKNGEYLLYRQYNNQIEPPFIVDKESNTMFTNATAQSGVNMQTIYQTEEGGTLKQGDFLHILKSKKNKIYVYTYKPLAKIKNSAELKALLAQKKLSSTDVFFFEDLLDNFKGDILCKIYSPYGERQDPFTGTSTFHRGADIPTRENKPGKPGEPAYAVNNGIIEKVYRDTSKVSRYLPLKIIEKSYLIELINQKKITGVTFDYQKSIITVDSGITRYSLEKLTTHALLKKHKDIFSELYSQVHTSYGSYVLIKHLHADGKTFTYETLYGHLESIPEYIKEGDIIKAGDLIAIAGETGKTQGRHLHFELLLKLKQINPKMAYREQGQKGNDHLKRIYPQYLRPGE